MRRPYIHHSGGTLCEPVDLPVNKRHLEMVYAHMQIFRQAVHGLGDASPSAREDTVRDVRDPVRRGVRRRRTRCCTSLINANSPLVWDSTMLGAAEVYARANQACIITPFILSGAMSPVDGRRHADAGARRSDGGHGVLPARAARRAGGVRHLRLDALDAVGRADLRHARGGARDLSAPASSRGA